MVIKQSINRQKQTEKPTNKQKEQRNQKKNNLAKFPFSDHLLRQPKDAGLYDCPMHLLSYIINERAQQ